MFAKSQSAEWLERSEAMFAKSQSAEWLERSEAMFAKSQSAEWPERSEAMIAKKTVMVKEILLWALRKRRPWRVQGESMEPHFRSGDLVLIDPSARVAVGNVVVARHPFKNVDVIKYVQAVDGDDYLVLQSPAGEASGQFGRVPLHTVRGTCTINLTTRRSR